VFLTNYINRPKVENTWKPTKTHKKTPISSTMSQKAITALFAVAFANGRLTGKRQIPRRGQIKSRIAATALNSIASMIRRK